MLKWLRANDAPWDESTCELAARNGHLEVLQWARANGCPWDGSTCTEATRKGHLEVLQWARANGCPRHVSPLAGRFGHLDLSKFSPY